MLACEQEGCTPVPVRVQRLPQLQDAEQPHAEGGLEKAWLYGQRIRQERESVMLAAQFESFFV